MKKIQDLHAENYKTSLKGITEDGNKQRLNRYMNPKTSYCEDINSSQIDL